MFEAIKSILHEIKDFLATPLFSLGHTAVSLWTFLYIATLMALLFFVSAKLRKWISEGFLGTRNVDMGVRQATGSIVRYIIVTLGFIVIVQTAGIDLSALTILAGALGIGVGFGLQNIVSNFVSGLIILFERPIKVGDRVEIDNVTGDVIRISWRSTTIVTNNNITIIVPNSEFITSRVTNWSYVNRNVRFSFPVPVSYNADVELVRSLLFEVVENHPAVLKEPKPNILLREFRESTMIFQMRIWTRDLASRPGVLQSELNYAVMQKFREHDIPAPYPRQEVHIRGGRMDIRVAPDEKKEPPKTE